MIKLEFLKILYKNKEARKLFDIKKTFYKNSYTYNEVLKTSIIRYMSDKEHVLYVIFQSPIPNLSIQRHLCKIVIKTNKFDFCSLHRSSTCPENNAKYARESYLVDYMRNYDRNMSICFGSVTYI